MTLKVIGFNEYVYICISLHSVGPEVLLKGTRKKRGRRTKGPPRFALGRLFLGGALSPRG